MTALSGREPSEELAQLPRLAGARPEREGTPGMSLSQGLEWHLQRLRLGFRRQSASPFPGDRGPGWPHGTRAGARSGSVTTQRCPSLLPETSCPTPSTATATWPGLASGCGRGGSSAGTPGARSHSFSRRSPSRMWPSRTSPAKVRELGRGQGGCGGQSVGVREDPREVGRVGQALNEGQHPCDQIPRGRRAGSQSSGGPASAHGPSASF